MPQRRQNSMVRTLISFIFGVVIAPSPCSISSQGTPRQPRSAASAKPTGPPPTISTGTLRTLGMTGSRLPNLVLVHSGVADDLAPHVALGAVIGVELLRIHDQRLEALLGQRRNDGRI